MRLVSHVLIAFAVLLSALVVPQVTAAPLTRVLVFAKTAGFRHSSIPQAIAAIRQLGQANGLFTRILLGGIQIAAGARAADCRPEAGYTAIFDGAQASFANYSLTPRRTA